MTSLRWPDRLFAGALVRRSSAYWAGVRLIVFAALGLPPAISGEGLAISAGVGTLLIVIAAAGSLSYWETHRRNELLLLANLGTPPTTIAVLIFTPIVLLEIGATTALVLWSRS